ncbi:MAG: hypothetical protein KQA31_02975 [Candidatus Aenigmarchaeota archaeon]|nr:hypothetical protein [Candidatus Aenigmarchaeota archaeon]
MNSKLILILICFLVFLPEIYSSINCPTGYTLCTQRTTPYCANLNNDRENCGACGNECEGPIDGGYCCVNGKCTDNTGQSCSYNPPSTTPQTTPRSTPTPQTTPTTHFGFPYLIKIKLKGDYDKSFEYSTIYLNGEKLKEVCRDCDVNCNLQNTKQVDEIKNIDIDKYCEETGYIQIAFADSAQVDECGSVYEACINMTNTNKEYCCQIKCDEEDCQNYVAFDCDSFNCINLQDIGIKQAICDTNKCNIRIFRNVLNKQVQISILFYDKDGVIYYKTSGNINKNFIGLKTFYLNNVNDCENNNLEIKINIIDGENLILTKKVGEIKC